MNPLLSVFAGIREIAVATNAQGGGHENVCHVDSSCLQ